MHGAKIEAWKVRNSYLLKKTYVKKMMAAVFTFYFQKFMFGLRIK